MLESGLPVLIAAAVVAAVGARIGIRRSRAAGHADPFHPLLFPSLYVAVASLGPAMWVWSGPNHPLSYISREVLTPRSPLLMALAAVGFTLGAGLPLRHRIKREVALDPNTLSHIGRLTVLLPIFLAARTVDSGGLQLRGMGQTIYTSQDSLQAAAYLLGPASVALIAAGRVKAGKSTLGAIDWILVAALVGLLGLTGSRAGSLGVMLVVLVFITRRGASSLRLLLGLVIVATFAYVVVTYRTEAVGQDSGLPVLGVLLRDLGSVLFTTGVTDRAIQLAPTLGGSTIVAGLVRQLPSPVAVPLLGPPDDSGSAMFRTMTGYNPVNNGYGFSLPAEGVINFGLLGAFLVPFVVGALLAWLYARFDVRGGHASQWAYVFAVATLPFAWRADVLGAVKGVLYPVLLMFVAIIAARTMHSYKTRVRHQHPKGRQRAHSAAR